MHILKDELALNVIKNLSVLRLRSPDYSSTTHVFAANIIPLLAAWDSLKELSIYGSVPHVDLFQPNGNTDIQPPSLTSLLLEDHWNAGIRIHSFLSHFSYPHLQQLHLISLSRTVQLQQPHTSPTAERLSSLIPTQPRTLELNNSTHLQVNFDHTDGQRLTLTMWTQNLDTLKRNSYNEGMCGVENSE